MNVTPKYPWRLDTNERYRDVTRTLMGLSTASLFLPVFFAREFLGIEKEIPLMNVLGTSVYWSWGLLTLAISSGIVFHYLSAKWIRLAWEQKAGFLWFNLSEAGVERAMEISFWVTIFAFMGGLALIIIFFVGYATHS